MKYKTITYKGYDIEISYDDMAINPFEDWDTEFPLFFNGGRNMHKDYSDGEIHSFIVNYLTDNQLIYHMNKILTFMGSSKVEFNINYPKDEYNKEERIDVLRDELNEYLAADLQEMSSFCDMFDIKHFYGKTRGYSQGDWAEVLICWTPKFGKLVGLEYSKVTHEMLKETFDLFTHWAWGDVFFYYIEDTGDSCGGFYGDDFDNNGLIEHAEDDINYHINNRIEKRQNKLKDLIKNNVPYEIRAKELQTF